jgi:hypothetical protein
MGIKNKRTQRIRREKEKYIRHPIPKHTMEKYLTVFFGKERVLKISNNENLTPEEKELYPKNVFNLHHNGKRSIRARHARSTWMDEVCGVG